MARALRLGEAAAAELAAAPDTPALALSDEALLAAAPDGADPAEFAHRLARLATHGPEAAAAFDPARASPAELLARVLSARGLCSKTP